MRLLSWTSLCIISSLLCTTCLAGSFGDSNSYNALGLLERRKHDPESAKSTVLDDPVAATTTDDNPKFTASNPPETSATLETSATAQTTSTVTSKQQSTKATASTSSRSQSTKEPSTSSDSSTSLTSTSSSSTSSSTSSTSSTISSTNIPQPTSILAPQPQSANHVSVGGIVAGAALGAAVLVGIAWIAIAKWRENKRHRAHFGDEEYKRGFGGAAGDGHYQDSLLAGGKPATGANGLKLKSLSRSSRAHSFVSPDHERAEPQVPQDVLPPSSPAQYKGLPELPRAEYQYSTPLGDHPHLAEMPSPYTAILPEGLQANRSVPRKALPQINISSPVYDQRSPSGHQQSPAAEFPG